MDESQLDELERQVIEQIAFIQREFQKQIESHLKQLARIQALRPSPPVALKVPEGIVPSEFLNSMGIR